MGVLEILQIIFIVLKVIGEITWPWPVVLIPLWIAMGLYTLIWVLFFKISFGLFRKFN